MSQSTAAFILQRLEQWGVTRIYGYPGDGINGLLGAFHEFEDRIDFIQTRHEEIAAFAACADAKLTDEVGVCMATSGPGAIHLLNGLYDAKLDHAPVVAIVGQQARMSMGSNFQQEVDLVSLFKDVASEFVQVCMTPEQAAHLIDRAVRIAKATRSVTCVIVPNDIQEAEYSEPPHAHGGVPSSVGFLQPVIRPRDDDLSRAADLLNAGERVAILVGQGALGAQREVIEVADLLGAGVAKALNGRAAVPDDLPFVTGSIGLLGTKPTYEMIEGCDTMLMVGSSFPYSEWLPEVGQARAVQIDIDGRLVGMRYPMELNLVGDSTETLRALIPLLQRKEDRDSGSCTDWWARHLRLRSGMKTALSGTLATMCPAIPYALAAKFAYPDRPVIAASGDGAFQMLGINTLIDIARYRDRWSNQQLVILVLHNDDLNQVTSEQRVMSGDPKLEVSQTLPDFPYARYAQLIGLEGIRVDSPEVVGLAWDQALSADGPVLIEAITDPEVPPLPPHIRFEQAQKLAHALPGDPARGRIMRQAIKGKVDEFIHR